MSRELNKELFDRASAPSSQTSAKSPYMAPEFEIREEDWKILVNQVEMLKRKNGELDAKISQLGSRTSDLLNTAKTRIERVASATQRLEDFAKAKFQEMSSKYSQVSGKLTESKVNDHKIEELIGRHNQALQSFEMRIHQLKKVIGEQELQLANSRAALKDAQREIARMKRL